MQVSPLQGVRNTAQCLRTRWRTGASRHTSLRHKVTQIQRGPPVTAERGGHPSSWGGDALGSPWWGVARVSAGTAASTVGLDYSSSNSSVSSAIGLIIVRWIWTCSGHHIVSEVKRSIAVPLLRHRPYWAVYVELYLSVFFLTCQPLEQVGEVPF